MPPKRSRPSSPENMGSSRRSKALSTSKRSPPAVPTNIDHWVEAPTREGCSLSAAEKGRMAVVMREELLRGRVPLPRNTDPIMVIPIAAPGSGKSTVTSRWLAAKYKDATKHFVDVDFDDAIHFHPKGPDLWNLRDVTTKQTLPIGSTETFFLCRQESIDVMRQVLRELIRKKQFHLVLHHLKGDALRPAKRLGYNTVLVFVAVPRSLAIKRALDRRRKLGRFFTADDVSDWWDIYREAMVGWSMWADEFYIIENIQEIKDNKPLVTHKGDANNHGVVSMADAQAQLDQILQVSRSDREGDVERDLDAIVGTENI